MGSTSLADERLVGRSDPDPLVSAVGDALPQQALVFEEFREVAEESMLRPTYSFGNLVVTILEERLHTLVDLGLQDDVSRMRLRVFDADRPSLLDLVPLFGCDEHGTSLDPILSASRPEEHTPKPYSLGP